MPILNNLTVNGSGPRFYIGLTKTSLNNMITCDTSVANTIDFTALGATNVDSFALAYAYSRCDNLRVVDMSAITLLSGQYGCYGMFSGSRVNSVNLSNLVTVSGYYAATNMFSLIAPAGGTLSYDLSKLETVSGDYGCSNMFHASDVASADLPALKTLSGGYACYAMYTDNPTLTTANVKNLTTVSGAGALREFLRNTSIVTMKFESLSEVSGAYALANALQDCSNLQSVYFYALATLGTVTSQFNAMLNGCLNVTVHFPIAIQSTIGSWSSVADGFGGTNTTVLFDIVTSMVGADTNTYQRQEKDSAPTATAWTYNNTLYYTSGNTEPQVGETIYSDAACTTAVTTISSIA